MKKMNRIVTISAAIAAFILIAPGMISGCKTPEAITNKSGAQLWGENCSRCHNTPDPTIYSDDQWDAATEHMRQKAILTDLEITKIRIFLKSAN